MTGLRLFALTALAMLAFAGNSLLCRAALKGDGIDAASFTMIRLVAGAVTMSVLVVTRTRAFRVAGSWWSGLALFIYAAGFSFAYLRLSAGIGALLLFGAVQLTMIGAALWSGQRMNARQSSGFVMAVLGLLGLLAPGLEAPAPLASCLMIAAGTAWGVYSLRGRAASDALAATAGNFVRSLPFALALGALALHHAALDANGALLALISGAVTSGIGYAIWYRALPHLQSTTAATIQLSVPVIAAAGGVVLLSEAVSLRLVLASIAVLGGIAIVITGRRAKVK